MKRIYYLLPLIAATVGDRLITVPNLRYESNPLVLSLGPSIWILLTTVLLGSFVYLFYWTLENEERTTVKITTYACVVCLSVLTISAVGINLIVLV